jgi:hypothetical protein
MLATALVNEDRRLPIGLFYEHPTERPISNGKLRDFNSRVAIGPNKCNTQHDTKAKDQRQRPTKSGALLLPVHIASFFALFDWLVGWLVGWFVYQ